MTLRIIILDFDGVVIESNEVKADAFRHIFARFPEHAKAMMAFHNEHVSLSRFAKFEHLLGLLGRADDESLKAEIAKDFSLMVAEKMMSVPLVPGAEDFLRKITPVLSVYLASVTPAEELSLTLAQRGLAHWFRGIYGCPPWTKPSAIQDILAREAVKPDSGLSFDSPAPLAFADMNEIAQHVEKLLS